MPRATWNGFLRLSLVSCPIYLSPATTETGQIRLHQINPDTGNRVRQQLVDAESGDPVDRSTIVKGYEFERNRYVVIDDDELKSLQIESSHTIDLDHFVKSDEIDPLYVDVPYYVYPDGKIAVETFQVICTAMEESGQVGIGRVVLSNRERMVLVEPRGGGMLMRTLRSASEVRAAEFDDSDGKPDAEMVKVAKTIIERRGGVFDPAEFHDRYQDALKDLVDSKAKGQTFTRKPTAEPPKIINLMEALKRSLAEGGTRAEPKRKAKAGDTRQGHLLLPVSGGKSKTTARTAERPRAAVPDKKRKKKAS